MGFGGGSSAPPPAPVQATVVPMRQLTEVPTASGDPKTKTFMDAGAAATFMGSGTPVQDPTKPLGSTMLGGDTSRGN